MKQLLKQMIKATGLSRQSVAETRLHLERHAMAALPRTRKRRHGRILAYHSVGQPEFGVNDVPPPLFRQQIEQALDWGYRFVPADDIANGHGGEMDLAITFDDGLRSVASAAAPVLAEHDIPWTLFVVTSWSDGQDDWSRPRVLNWSELADLARAGAQLGSHSVTHPDFSKISNAQARDELFRSREMFEDNLGFTPTTFAIPYGQSGNWTPQAGELAHEAGYDIVYAQAEDTRPDDTIARTFVTRSDSTPVFRALLDGVYDQWEEWF